MFKPKIVETFKNYSREQFIRDLLAGLIVGVVALPLAIAFGIASGVAPEKGLYTAVIAGFIISALGGSRVQIGGPTGAFIVIVYGIVQQYGINGLIIATFLAGIMLIVMGLSGLGAVIKFIPHPLIVGFTSGIALIILSSQVKDFFGLSMPAVPVDFLHKWKAYTLHFQSLNLSASLIGFASVLIILFWPKITRKVPGSLLAILITTAVVQIFHLPVETIGSRFGNISSAFPSPSLPHLDFNTIRNLIQPAFTIALLGGIESLLSAVVADGMIGGNHRSNTELIAQGAANIASAVFGGIPATGAIARTATNIKNGGRTPVAGIVHAITLLLIMLFIGRWAALIPMATLGGILVIVAYNMSEWENFVSILKGSRSDIAVLLTTFLLTVLIDLTVAIEIGMVLAVFLFMRKMIQSSEVSKWRGPSDDDVLAGEEHNDNESIGHFQVPKQVEVFEITGPLFFGAAYKFKDAIRQIEKAPRVLIIRMRKVPVIDATGIRILKEVNRESRQRGTKLILSEVCHAEVMQALKDARLLFEIGKANVTETFELALKRSMEVLGIPPESICSH
jgi:sulfate permease, SulP family